MKSNLERKDDIGVLRYHRNNYTHVLGQLRLRKERISGHLYAPCNSLITGHYRQISNSHGLFEIKHDNGPAFAFADTKFIRICKWSTYSIVNYSIQFFVSNTSWRCCCCNRETSTTFTFAVILENGIRITFIATDTHSACQCSETDRTLVGCSHFGTRITSATSKSIRRRTHSTGTIWKCVE